MEGDWITSFLSYSEGINSPYIFRLWAGIATIAGALERKVWVETGRGAVFPNLYVMLIAPPGVGKSRALDYVSEFWLTVPGLKVSPDSVTKAALVDAVADATRKIILNPTTMIDFNSLQVVASELGVLLPSHDLEFLNTLNHIYDNPRSYRERRRHLKDVIEIVRPQLNIIGGTQPAYLASLLPEEAWGMGFMSRMIMVYNRELVKVALFHAFQFDPVLKANLVKDLRSINKLYGKFEWTDTAKTCIETWVKEGCPPQPEHSKLEHYRVRRPLHMLKLMQISAASRGDSPLIDEEDFNRALQWLLLAEENMPDVFKDMVYKSDIEVIKELHLHIFKIYMKEGKKPVHEQRLYNFLSAKVPSERIPRILETADKSGIIRRNAGTETYTPQQRLEDNG